MPNTEPVASSTIQNFNGPVQSFLETFIVSRSHTAAIVSSTYVFATLINPNRIHPNLDDDKINSVV